MDYGIVNLRVKGVSPVLMHNPAGTMRAAGGDEIVRGGKKIDAPDIEAAKGLYSMPNGQLFIPAEAFREAGLIAAADVRDPTRRGRAMMTRRFGASVFLSKIECPLFRAGDNGDVGEPLTENPSDWETYVKRVVVQHQGVMRGRALVRDWIANLEFEYDPETIDPGLIAAIVNGAGKFPGVLDYRVGKKGPFGRYQVVGVDGETFGR